MELCSLSQNLDVNWVPLSDTIFLGTPCKHTILVIYNSASFGPWYVSLTGMKWATLVRRSTITHMESYPDWVRGNPTIKSMLISSHFHSGVMWYYHELGEGWSSEDSVIRCLE